MNKTSRSRLSLITVFSALVSPCVTAAAALSQLENVTLPKLSKLLDSPNLKDVRFEQHIGAQLPLDATMIDEHGQRQSIGSYFGRLPVILVFSYYRCPNLCTLVLNGLVDGLKSLPDLLGKDYQVMSVSIDPKEKPPLALAKQHSYLARLGLGQSPREEIRLSSNSTSHSRQYSWPFLTGEETQIRRIADQAGFHYQKDPESGDYAHLSGIIVLSPKGSISQYLFGIQFDPKELHQALLRAKSDQIGTWADQILLYCFHYDPKLSRNGPWIMKMIQLSGIFAVLILIRLLLYLRQTDRKDRVR